MDSWPGAKPACELDRPDRHGTRVLEQTGQDSGAPKQGLHKGQDQGSNSMQLLHETGPRLHVAWEWLQQVYGTGEGRRGSEGCHE